MTVIGPNNQIIVPNAVGEIGYVLIRFAGDKKPVLPEQVLTVREFPSVGQQPP